MILKNPAFQRTYKNIIFDFDGTINNTEVGITNTFKKVLDFYKIDYSNIDFKNHIGPPLEHSFRHLVGNEKWQDALALYRKTFEADDARKQCRLYDGIVEVLETLYQKNYKLAIATSKYEPYARESVKDLKIEKYFSEIYGQIGNRGYKNEILKQLIENCGWDKSDCLMIGDTAYDIDGARDNGIAVLAVSYGFESRENLLMKNPDALVDSPLELIEAVCQ